MKRQYIDVNGQPRCLLEKAERRLQAAETKLSDIELILELRSVGLTASGQIDRVVNVWATSEPTVRQITRWRGIAWRAKEYQAAKDLDRWVQQSFPDLDVLPVWLEDEVLILESFDTTKDWFLCLWCNVTAAKGGYLVSDGQVAKMGYHNTTFRRDHLAYWLRPELPIDSFSTLVLRLKGKTGTPLTIELVVDGKRNRSVSYQPVADRWEVLSVPINGYVLNEILIGIGEPGIVDTPREYGLLIDWIGLR